VINYEKLRRQQAARGTTCAARRGQGCEVGSLGTAAQKLHGVCALLSCIKTVQDGRLTRVGSFLTHVRRALHSHLLLSTHPDGHCPPAAVEGRGRPWCYRRQATCTRPKGHAAAAGEHGFVENLARSAGFGLLFFSMLARMSGWHNCEELGKRGGEGATRVGAKHQVARQLHALSVAHSAATVRCCNSKRLREPQPLLVCMKA
jgi:hypothetical protein